jgi:hypothetical protein
MDEKRVRIWHSLVGWIDQPKKTLRYVIKESRWPQWLAPVLIILAASIVVTVVSAPLASEMSRQQAEEQMQAQMASIPEEQEDQVMSTIDTFTSPLFVAAMGIVFTVLGLILTWLFRGALLFFIGYVLGTDNRYIQMVTLVLWAWLPFALRDLVQAIYVLLNGQLPINKGLSFLVASGDQLQNAGNLLYGFLGQIDIFLVWHLLLVGVGIAVTTRSTTTKTAFATIGYWIVTALIGLSPGLLQMLVTPSLTG